jgi:hypothetical protein
MSLVGLGLQILHDPLPFTNPVLVTGSSSDFPLVDLSDQVLCTFPPWIQNQAARNIFSVSVI